MQLALKAEYLLHHCSTGIFYCTTALTQSLWSDNFFPSVLISLRMASGFFHATKAELNICDRLYDLQSWKFTLFGPWQKQFADPCPTLNKKCFSGIFYWWQNKMKWSHEPHFEKHKFKQPFAPLHPVGESSVFQQCCHSSKLFKNCNCSLMYFLFNNLNSSRC